MSASRLPFTTTQTVTLVALGALFWFIAALVARAVEPLGAYEGFGVVILYALIIPGTVPVVLIVQKLAKLRNDQLILGMTLATAAATLLDGLALVLIPWLYGPNTAGAAAAILWGAGVGLFLAMAMTRPTP